MHVAIFPDFSKQASTYLAKNFPDDDDVVAELWRFAEDNAGHSQVRLHTLEALIEMRGFSHVETYLLSNSFEDWHLHYQILDLFPKYSNQGNTYFQYFYNLALTTDHSYLRAKALKLAFEQSPTKDNQVSLINFALDSHIPFFGKMAVYLWQKQIDIEANQLSLDQLDETYEALVAQENVLDTLRDFRTNFKRLFGFQIDENFPIEKLFANLEKINQLLLSAHNAQEQEMNEFVRSIYNLTTNFLSSVATIQSDSQIREEDLQLLLRKKFREDNITRANTGALLNYYDETQDGGYAHPSGKQAILAQTKALFLHHMHKMHNDWGYKLQVDTMYDVFICYNKKDASEVVIIRELLIKNNLTPWMDKYDIRPGLPWQTEILTALDRDEMKAAIICLSDNGIGRWQDREHQVILTNFDVKKKPIIPVILRSAATTPPMSGFLAINQWLDFREVDPNPENQLVFGITGKNPNH